ncbi:hypothetical protein F4604DRAFT_1714255 [Suillus subluteus]|nr:hypothetical protein F4604DRAFT_1714255 [Suillus subluteus]
MNYPLIISFACNHYAPGHLKDTIANLRNSQGFTVNIISELFVENTNVAAIDLLSASTSGLSAVWQRKNACVLLYDTIYAVTTRCSRANNSLPRQGKRF